MAVITISRQFGAGGRTLGKMLAKRLDYILADETLIQEMAKEANVSVNWVKSMERTAGSLMSRLMTKTISRNYMQRLVGMDRGYLDESVYVELLHRVVTEFAKQDNVIILGRGGQYILRETPSVYHVLLVANQPYRIDFIRQFYEMTTAKADAVVKDGEARRRNLYMRLGKKNYNDPNLYHLAMNMSRLSLETAMEVVCTLVHKAG